MDLNADFDRRASMHGDEIEWLPSPMPGVDRRMLERIGDEVARATSIVRYRPGRRFSPHVHAGGEEFLVLDGVFQDEHGDYPTGWYVRNPPQSRHTPGSAAGCTILVKLWQFDPADRTPVRVDTGALPVAAAPERPGVRITPLFADARESVRLEHWPPGARIALPAPRGAELFVLEGDFDEGGERFRAHSWLRVPVGGTIDATAGAAGARLWVKSGHLPFASPPRDQN